MKWHQRLLAAITAAAMLVPAASLAEPGAEEFPEEELTAEEIPGEEYPEEEWESAEPEAEYAALSMWMSESEGTVSLFDTEDNPLELEEDMRFSGGTVLETAEESLAVVDMDRKRLAIMDEISRAGFEKTDHGDRISITLQDGAMYFRVGKPLEENESLEINMEDIRLAIRGTCGMVQRSEEGMTVVLASGRAVIARAAGEGEDPDAEPEEIEIGAGEAVSVTDGGEAGGFSFEKRRLEENEVPPFLTEAFRRDAFMLEKVYAESGWQPEKLFGDDIPMWMPPAEELGGIPDEWIGKTIGCGGWFHIAEYMKFPSKQELIHCYAFTGYDDPEVSYTVLSVKRYTPHFYELRCSSEKSIFIKERGIITPGITEEETRLLAKCQKIKLRGDRLDMIPGQNRYIVLECVGGAYYGFGNDFLFFDDITATGPGQAKPFVDFRPCGYFGPDVQGIGPGAPGSSGEVPDSLVGRTLVRKRKVTANIEMDEAYEFVSKSTVKVYTYSPRDTGQTNWRFDPEGEPYEVMCQVSTTAFSDHFIGLLIYERGNENHIYFLEELILPGMSDEEKRFCEEVLESASYLPRPNEVIDGDHYYMVTYSDENVVHLKILECR